MTSGGIPAARGSAGALTGGTPGIGSGAGGGTGASIADIGSKNAAHGSAEEVSRGSKTAPGVAEVTAPQAVRQGRDLVRSGPGAA